MRTFVFVFICSAFAGPLHGKEIQYRHAAKDRPTAESEVSMKATSFCQKDGKQLKIISMGVAERSLKPREKVLAGLAGDSVEEVHFQGHEGGSLSEIGESGKGRPVSTKKIFEDYYRKNPKARKAKSAAAYTAVISFQCEKR